MESGDKLYYYCKLKADGRLSTCKEIISISKDMVISAMYRSLDFGEELLIFDTKKEYKEAKAKADDEYNERIRKENEFHIEELTDFAKRIYNVITDEQEYSVKIETKDVAKRYSLFETKYEPYYVCYGHCGEFANYNRLLDLSNNMIKGHSDNKDIAIYDVKTGGRIYIIVERISIGNVDDDSDYPEEDE